MSKLEALFNPRSVAVIGASATPGKTGYNFTMELFNSGFGGKIYPINPKGGNIEGHIMYTSLDEVDGPVDLALLLVSKKIAVNAVRDCAEHGVKFGVMYTAGFGEMGEAGKKVQDEMIRVANEHGMRIVGPNCMGVFSHPAHLNLTGEDIPSGQIGLISQSGNIGYSLWYDARYYLHTGFSRFVGFGNQADLALHDYIDFYADDPETKVIAIYFEGLRADSGLDFIRSASAAAKKKPVVVLKGGCTAAGRSAATSHTGSLAGNDALYSAAFKKAGIVEVQRLDELMPVAQTLMLCPPVQGTDIAVGGTGGGHMIVSTDAAERNGFTLPPYSEKAYNEIAELLYDFAPKGNPFEQAGTFIDNINVWGQTAKIILAEPQMNGLFTFGNIGGYMPEESSKGLAWSMGMQGLVDEKNKSGKPVVAFSLCARTDHPCNRVLREGGIPVFDSPDIAMRAFKALRERYEFAQKRQDIPALPQRQGMAPALFDLAKNRAVHNLTEAEAYQLFAEYGVNSVRHKLATTAQEAVAVADAIGYPVVMKIISPQIIHKSEYNAVRVGLKDAAAVSQAFEEIIDNCRIKAPEAEINGVLIAQQTKGTEMIAGLVRDRQFGPVLMLGMGGIFVEIMKDVDFCILPTTKQEIRDKLSGLKSFPIINGARGGEKANLEALVDLYYRISLIAVENPEIAELDINPLFISAEGAVAADARIVIKN